jgi:hypothetical protein
MNQKELLTLAKSLKMCDERELLSKIVISRTEMAKALNLVFGMNQGAGPDGFVGICQNELVCYEANLWGAKPETERFRIAFGLIESHEIKKGFLGLNNQFLIRTKEHFFKLFFTNGRRPLIEAIDKAIIK